MCWRKYLLIGEPEEPAYDYYMWNLSRLQSSPHLPAFRVRRGWTIRQSHIHIFATSLTFAAHSKFVNYTPLGSRKIHSFRFNRHHRPVHLELAVIHLTKSDACDGESKTQCNARRVILKTPLTHPLSVYISSHFSPVKPDRFCCCVVNTALIAWSL